MQGCRNKDVIDAVRDKAKKLGITPEDVEEAVKLARRGGIGMEEIETPSPVKSSKSNWSK